MAGSRKWHVYTTDANNSFAIQLDESNTEAVMAGVTGLGDFTDTTAITQAVPRNISPRCVYYANAARTREIKCVVLTQAQYNDIVAGTSVQTITDPIEGTATLTLVRANGEKFTLPFAQDTGLIDGDVT